MHAAWGLGSSFPKADRVQLADAVAGVEEMPSAAACFLVAGTLAAAAGVVAGLGRSYRVVRWARGGVAAALLVRGVVGVSGATVLLVPWTPSTDFQQLDRRRYGPLCLALATAIALTSGD